MFGAQSITRGYIRAEEREEGERERERERERRGGRGRHRGGERGRQRERKEGREGGRERVREEGKEEERAGGREGGRQRGGERETNEVLYCPGDRHAPKASTQTNHPAVSPSVRYKVNTCRLTYRKTRPDRNGQERVSIILHSLLEGVREFV